MRTDVNRLPPITLLAVIVEFFIIIFFSLNAASNFLGNDPNLRLPGYEGEYLTSSATFAFSSMKTYGYIPLWQPYLAHGEPLIDNPFSLVMNPVSVIPTLLYGSNIGIRYSIVLTAILAGLGGWALGRMLGFGSLARVLLGLLLMGKGNMIAMIAIGEFQLGGSQAYIPWVMAGIIGVLRLPHQRLSIVLTALMFTLMFWAGNVYFLLPTLMSVVGLVLTHTIEVTREDGQSKFTINPVIFRRVVLAGLLTIGLSAITLLPIFLQQKYVGGHPPENGAGIYADLPAVISMFFSDSNAPYELGLVQGGREFYQSFVIPFWFALLAFIVFPILSFIVERPSKSQAWKVASVGLVMIVFCTLWGAGQKSDHRLALCQCLPHSTVALRWAYSRNCLLLDCRACRHAGGRLLAYLAESASLAAPGLDWTLTHDAGHAHVSPHHPEFLCSFSGLYSVAAGCGSHPIRRVARR